ncbi:MAG: hypothetical protein ACREJU_11485 [Nitrospiraceae bacterium]
MVDLAPVTHPSDILPAFRDTPIADLLAYHNLAEPHGPYEKARLLVGMCMDHRERLRIPENFSYILRAGANLLDSEFQVSYAIAIGGISAIALIVHTHCGYGESPQQARALHRWARSSRRLGAGIGPPAFHLQCPAV